MTDQCKACADLRKRYDIREPRDLKKAIRVAKANVADGTLRVIPRKGPTYWCGPFEQLKDEPPWDDLLSYQFRCAHCGTEFSLTCDTYHGNGRWEPQ